MKVFLLEGGVNVKSTTGASENGLFVPDNFCFFMEGNIHSKLGRIMSLSLMSNFCKAANYKEQEITAERDIENWEVSLKIGIFDR